MKFNTFYSDEKTHKFALHLIGAFFETDNINQSNTKCKCAICKEEGFILKEVLDSIPQMDNITDAFISSIKKDLGEKSETYHEDIKKAKESLMPYMNKYSKQLISSKKSDKIICRDCRDQMVKFCYGEVIMGNKFLTNFLYKVKGIEEKSWVPTPKNDSPIFNQIKNIL